MPLQVTFGIEPVQNKAGREGEDQNQYQRVDAHTHAPVPLQARDIRTENATRNVTGAKYLAGVAKISQTARTQSDAMQSRATTIAGRAPASFARKQERGDRFGRAQYPRGDSPCPIYACRPSRRY
jgi:hypothetical protein